MKIKLVLAIILFGYVVSFPAFAQAQTPYVQIRLEADGSEVITDELRIRIQVDDKMIVPEITGHSFLVPPEIEDAKEINVLIEFKEQELQFKSLTKHHFDTKWIVGVDFPPFNVKDKKLEKKGKKKVKLVYYIEFCPRNAEGTKWVTRVYK